MPNARLSDIDAPCSPRSERTGISPPGLVGLAFQYLLDDGVGQQTGDLILFARLRALIKAGRVEKRGGSDHIRDCEVRLPAKRS